MATLPTLISATPSTGPLPIAFPEPRNTVCLWLSFLSPFIPGLLEAIDTDSPDITHALKNKKNKKSPTVRQIREARKNSTGFAKLAIPLAIKLQVALNTVAEKMDEASFLKIALRGFFSSQNEIPEKMRDKVISLIEKILNQENEASNAQTNLGDIAQELGTITTDFALQWKQHEDNFTEQLITELENELGSLSDLEKTELKSKTKSPSDIRGDLRKQKIEIKKFDNPSNFQLKAINAIISAKSRTLQQANITVETIKGVMDKLKSINNEKKNAETLAKTQQKEYKEISKKIIAISSKIEKKSLQSEQIALENSYNDYRQELRTAALVAQRRAVEKPEL
jgi:hypothetical protein